MVGEGLFAPITTTDALLEATGSAAWLAALLDAEAALARAQADEGVIPRVAADAIAAACRPDRFDVDELGRAARGGGNPVIPLVTALGNAVGAVAEPWVHHGATSQDILDTAAVLVARRSLVLVRADLDGLADACATLADRHRHTTMAGRTLLQHALPTTFGLKAAGWLGGTLDATALLDRADADLAAQLGGAVGTLASLGADGPAVAARFAAHLELAEPTLPWHTARQRLAALASALAIVAGTAAKISGDVALLAQTEVAEAAEPAAAGRGGSSAMPHKRNPVGAAAVSSAARRAAALVPVVLGALVAEHERALGGWQAEWETVTELLALAGGAAARTHETVAGLEVDADAMAANLARTGGVALAERISLALAPTLGRSAAQAAVAAAARRSRGGGSFADELRADPDVAAVVGHSIDALLDPASYLGANDVWIGRALAAHHQHQAQRLTSRANSRGGR